MWMPARWIASTLGGLHPPSVDCIHPKKDEPDFESANQLYIDPVECIDCGACVPVCPVSAIFALDDLPEEWANFTDMNTPHYKR